MLTFYEMVGQRIIEQLNKLGWTQQNLANKLNISKQVMSKILNGEKNTTILEIRNIADQLTVSVEKLLSPVNEKISLLNKEKSSTSLPEFMGRVSTPQGIAGVNKAMQIIDMIVDYEKSYKDTMEIRNQRVDFTRTKKKRTFNPNI